METEKKKRGRPATGKKQNVTLARRVDATTVENLAAIALQRGISQSEALRQLIRENAPGRKE